MSSRKRSPSPVRDQKPKVSRRDGHDDERQRSRDKHDGERRRGKEHEQTRRVKQEPRESRRDRPRTSSQDAAGSSSQTSQKRAIPKQEPESPPSRPRSPSIEIIDAVPAKRRQQPVNPKPEPGPAPSAAPAPADLVNYFPGYNYNPEFQPLVPPALAPMHPYDYTTDNLADYGRKQFNPPLLTAPPRFPLFFDPADLPPPPPPPAPPAPAPQQPPQNFVPSTPSTPLFSEEKQSPNSTYMGSPGVNKIKPETKEVGTLTGESLLIPELEKLQGKIDAFNKKKAAAKAALKAKEDQPGSSTAGTSNNEAGSIPPLIDPRRDQYSLNAHHLFSPELLETSTHRQEASKPFVMGKYQMTLLVRVNWLSPQIEVAELGLSCCPLVETTSWRLACQCTFWAQSPCPSSMKKKHFREAKVEMTFSAERRECWIPLNMGLKMYVLKNYYLNASKMVEQHFEVKVFMDGWRRVGEAACNDFTTKSQNWDTIVTVGKTGTKLFVNLELIRMWSPKLASILVREDGVYNPVGSSNDIIELLRVIYPEQKPLSDDSVLAVLHMAIEWEVPSIVIRCEDFLMGGTSSIPMLKRINIAYISGLDRLQQSCLNEIVTNRDAKAIKVDPLMGQLCKPAKCLILEKLVTLM